MFLNEISDDWLICLYREGNQIAIDLLFERYTLFLYGFIHKMMKNARGYYEYAELFQEVFIVFISCIERYDEENGCFYYFVKMSVERKLIDVINKMKRLDRIVSLDASFYDGGYESCIDYVAEEPNVEYYQTNLYKNLSMVLTREEMRIIDLKVEGYSYQEIADIISSSKQSIYRKVIHIKNIIKDIIEKID